MGLGLGVLWKGTVKEAGVLACSSVLLGSAFLPTGPCSLHHPSQDQPPRVGKALLYLVTAGIVRVALAVGWGAVEALRGASTHSRNTEAYVEWRNGREG